MAQEATLKASDQLPHSIDLAAIQSHIFQEKNGNIYIGGQLIDKQMRELLRDQAEYILRSDLWEIFNATITNEAANLALVQSMNWEHVNTAKMLHHWIHVMKNIVVLLGK